MIYSKFNPSKEYLQHISFYKDMHKNGFKRTDGSIEKKNAYDGITR